MTVSILSFGYADSILPLVNRLADKVDLELILVYSKNRKGDSVLNFENMAVQTGFVNDSKVNAILGDIIKSYLNPKLRIRIFIYFNLKIRSVQNTILSLKLAGYLRQFDLIHINGQNAVIPLIYIFLPFCKFVFSIHDLEVHSGEKKQKQFDFSEVTNRMMIKSRHQVVLQNKNDYNAACEKYSRNKDTINYIPFGNLDIFRSFINHEEKPELASDLLFFGRISEYKGIEYLIEAFRIVLESNPDTTLIIAGSGKIYFNSILNDHTSSIKLINRHINNEELASLISQTRIVICPYTDATQSGVVMTAFAFNKPVIASAVGGFPDVIHSNITGLLVPPKDSVKLAEAILFLLRNKNLIQDISVNIINFNINSEFSWDRISEKYKELYISSSK